MYDLFICLDTSQKDRLTKGTEFYFDMAKATINVDHHVSNTQFAQVNHVAGEASSASEVVYDLLDRDKIGLAAAEALYMGIICDSGAVSYTHLLTVLTAIIIKRTAFAVSALAVLAAIVI